jgi:3-oxoacyl-[acyl-carrier protein] reductase
MSIEKVALVTGGTRRIGLAIARQLALSGYALSLTYIRNQEAAMSSREALQVITPHVYTLRADITTPEGAQEALLKTKELLGTVNLLVNNVGPFVPGNFMETTAENYQQMVDGNLGSMFHTSQAVIPLMRTQGSGCIINLGSLNAEVARGAPNAALYHALKAAIVVLTKSIARSEGPFGIRANVVNPGVVDTLGIEQQIAKRIPLRRLGTPEDVAKAVVWLASDEASYVNGAVLNVHGGLWA